MGLRFLVLQHVEWEGPGGLLLETASQADARLTVTRVWRDPLPADTPFDGLIVLGGGPNVDQIDSYPFLTSEKAFIGRWIADNRPYLGFCLGHQLLAEILGARVGPNFMPSIGVTRGFLTCEGRTHPAFTAFPRAFPLLKWHAQAVLEPLPKQVALLATSKECQVEAISAYGRPHILGLQYDNHAATPADLHNWLEQDRSWLLRFGVESQQAQHLMSMVRQQEQQLRREFHLFFNNYLRLLI